MNKFSLETKNGEVVHVTNQDSIELAIEFFSILKKLKIKDLLKIYNVKKYEDRNNN
jgi:hypothetical protein